MTIAAVRASLKTALDTISSIEENHPQVPQAIGKLPATVADLERVRYHETLDGVIVQEWRLLLLLAEQDSKAAHDDLDPYLAVSGSDSIKATLEAATIGDEATVRAAENIGFVVYQAKTFVGTEFVVEVTETA